MVTTSTQDLGTHLQNFTDFQRRAAGRNLPWLRKLREDAFERFANVLRAGGELGADVSMLKILATELYQRITEEMLEVAGEEARFADDLEAGNEPIDAMNLFLDSRAPAIFGGSNEIQKNILAKAVLELPG